MGRAILGFRPPHAVAYLHDIFLLGAILVVVRAIRCSSPNRLRAALEVLSIVGLLSAGAFLSIYPQLLREYLAFPVNIFKSDSESAHILLTEYLGVGSIVASSVSSGRRDCDAVVPVRLAIGRRTRFVLWTLVAVIGIATLPRSPQPFFFSLKQQAADAFVRSERVVPSLQRPPARARTAQPAAAGSLPADNSLSADSVFLIVLEGVTSGDFENEFLTASAGFFARVRERAAYFRRYYATNLDSYTSLIAMLTSIQVPYRAYTDESLYKAVNQSENLTCSLRRLGFHTLFISTYAHQPFVPNRIDWDRVMDRSDLPSLKGLVSVGSSRMEAATEDRAALSAIVETAASHPKSFILHELVYGHSTEWRAKTGKTQLAYYDTYLCDLLGQLTARGLDSRSLLVIVSDHGDRAKAAVVENYRVPLLVVGQHVRPYDDAEFRSHLNLVSIVTSYLTGTALPPPASEAYVVGSTERWVYGTIISTGEHLFIDDTTGTVLSHSGDLNPLKVSEAFQSSLNEFGARFGH